MNQGPPPELRRMPGFLGLALITVGVLFLLRELEVLPDISFWTLFWLALGGWLFIATMTGGRRGWFWPLTLLAIGIAMLLRDLEVLDADFKIWPVVLIAVGVSILLQGASLRRHQRRSQGEWMHPRDG